MKKRNLLFVLLLIAGIIVGCSEKENEEETGTKGGNAGGKRPDEPAGTEFVYSGHEPIWLDQGWTRGESLEFYFKDQGSELIPYEWFLTLEEAGSERLFRSDEHLIELGFITQPKSTKNPDALPIGFVLDDNPATLDTKLPSFGKDYKPANYPKTERWIGFTCASCHTADITYQGNVIRIDGGPAMTDHEKFLAKLAAAMRATCDDDEKFARFEARNKGPDGTFDTGALRDELTSFTDHIEALVERNKAPHAYGYARLDAFGAILNEISAAALDLPENRRVSDAPVSFPYLWHMTELDFVQWNRSADNAIARNVGEVLGVFAHLQLVGTPETGQFRSTANMDGLDRIEQLLTTLKAPLWPEEIFGELDPDKIKLGSELYAKNCIACHPIRDAEGKFPMTAPNAAGFQFIKTLSFKPEVIGTDPKMVMNVLTRNAKPGILRPLLPEADREQEEVPAATLLGIAVEGVLKRFAGERNLNQQQLLALAGGHIPDPSHPNIPTGYIARPLYGIWATAPYLHNGSVPNLYQLLLPEDQRVTSFFVGSREFDPENVGFLTTKDAVRSSKFETHNADGTPIPGNSNLGHSGPGHTQTKGEDDAYRDFTDEERWALIEYLKTLK